MSEVRVLMVLVFTGVLFSLLIPQTVLYVTGVNATTENLTGFWGGYTTLVNANVTLGAGWFSTEINLVPFQSFRDFLTELAVGWSYVPNPVTITIGVTFLVGGLYALIKALPTT